MGKQKTAGPSSLRLWKACHPLPGTFLPGKSSAAKTAEDTILRSEPLAQFRVQDGGGGGN